MTEPLADQPPTRWSRAGFWIGLGLFGVLLAAPPPASMRRAAHTVIDEAVAVDARRASDADDAALDARAETMMAAAAVTVLVAVWWMTVAVPIPMTSLLPLLLFPVVGVMPIARAAPPYANPNVFLFMGGFILALAMQRWGLHRRVALHVIRCLGSSESGIVLGFMVASAALSMWISNTATAMMLLPIGLAVIHACHATPGVTDDGNRNRFAAALMLGIAYAASIGGLATPIGTPPNIAFRGQVARLFPEAPGISFAQWTLMCVPLVVVLLPVAWLVLVRISCPLRRGRLPLGRGIIEAELRGLGPMGRAERTVAAVFAATAALWMTRRLPVGDGYYGWSRLLERWLGGGEGPAAFGFRADYIDDASVALLAAVVLFVLPARRSPEARGERLMDWDTARRLPWGILLLFGGGFSIAEGFSSSGLSQWCGQVFADVGIASPLLLVLGTCLLITFLTEITSNTATSQVMLPILSRVAVAMQVHPLLLMLPATLSASCAFMLPVATPPNAIVFGSGHVRMKDMIRSGLLLNLLGAIVITAVFHFLIGPLLGIEQAIPKEWSGAVIGSDESVAL